MTKRNNAGVYQKSNGFWEYRFTIVVDGQQISRKKSTDEFGNKLKTKSEAIRAREKPQFSRLGQIENVKGKLNGKR